MHIYRYSDSSPFWLPIKIFRSFKNYVDKMSWVGGQKMPIFVHVIFTLATIYFMQENYCQFKMIFLYKNDN